VIRGTGDSAVNRALDEYGIPYVVFPHQTYAEKWVLAHESQTLILDGNCGSRLDDKASLYLWRLGRREHPNRPIQTIHLEGPRSRGPILLLEDKEILSRRAARKALGLPLKGELTLGIPSTCRPGVVESHPMDHLLTEWPALKYMRAADHIVGCIGANLYAEVNYLGIPVTWIKAPNASDQSIRIVNQFTTPNRSGAAQEIAAVIENIHRTPS